VVSNPRGKKYYGGSVSGPVFKELAEKVYATRLGVVDEKGEYQANCNSFTTSSMVYFNDFMDYCNMENIPFVDNVENGEWVSVQQNNDELFVNSVKFEDKIVPDMTGMNVTDAVYVLESMGWKVKFDGYGKVKSQSVNAGTELRKGSVINLTLTSK
jgi:cell division protein FtsI (penicillin-binding protein 3)